MSERGTRPGRTAPGHSIEALESRIAPATFVLPTGQGPFTLELDPVDAHIHITGGAAGEIFDQGLAPGDDLFVTGGGGADTFTIASSAAGNVIFTGTLSVNIPGPIIVTGAARTGGDFALTSGASITYSTAMTLGTLGAHFSAAGNIIFTNNSALTTNSGNIVLIANQTAGQVAGQVVGPVGIQLDHANLTSTGAGSIMLTGNGSNVGDNNVGIALLNDTQIISTSAAPTAGKITLIGKGGVANNGNHGVLLTGANSLISSVGGAIAITGFGGGAGTGNNGVLVTGGGKISAKGAATLTLTGTEGNGAEIEGIKLDGVNTTVESTGGGGLTLIADNIRIEPTAILNAATGVAKLRPMTKGIQINLGGPDVPKVVLGLTDAELDRVAGATVEIGDPSSGGIFLTAAITADRSLTLTSGANVTGGAPLTMVPSANLTINATGGIDLTGAITVPGGKTTLTAGAAAPITLTNAANDFGTVSIGGGGTVSLRDDGGFDLGATTVSTLLTVASAGTITQSATLAGAGGLTKTGAGTLILSNLSNTFGQVTALGPATVTIAGGVLQVAADGALGNITNRIVIDNATLKTTGAFASGRQIVQIGVATIDVAGSSLTLIGNVGDPATLQANHIGGGTLQFAFVFVDNLPVLPGTPVVIGGTSVAASGGATATVHTVGGLGTQIDTITITNTSTLTSLIINGPGTINRIVADGDLGSVVLGPGVVLGDGVRDSVPDLQITGKSNKLQLYDLSSYAFIDLGGALPYNAPGTTISDTYNNRPDLTIHDVKGPDVLIDVTGNGTDDGTGGGGLGKVVVNNWHDFPAAIRTTQSIGSFKLSQGDSYVVFEVDKFHHGHHTTAGVGNMVIQNGNWGSSGTEIEGGVRSFDADGFLAGATLTAGSMGLLSIGANGFAGLLTLTDPDAVGIPTFTVNSDFTGSVDSESPLRKIKVKGDFMGDLEAPFIGSITAYSFFDAVAPTKIHTITATDGSLGTLTATAGVVGNFTIITAQAFQGFNVKLSKLTGDTIGIDNVHIEALSIGNISVSLAAAATAPAGLDLIGIRNSEFITTGTGATKPTLGSIGNVSVTLTGVANGTSATGIEDSIFDALVTLNEFGVHPASTVNPLGKIAVKIAGQGGLSLGLDHVAFAGNSIGATTVSVSKGQGGTAHAIELADFTATGAIGALSIDGDASSAQVNALTVSAGTNVGAVTVKSKDLQNGTLKDSAILAGQSLDVTTGTAPELLAKLAKATLGAVNVTGSIINTDLVAGSSIGAVTAGRSLTDSLILAGAKLGADGVLGGSGGDKDTFQRAASIAAITVKGASGGTFASTSIAAGVNPVNGIFGDAGDTAAPAAGLLPNTSSIGPVSIPAGVLAAVSGSQIFAIEAAKITSLKIGAAPAFVFTPATPPQLLDLAPSGLDGGDVIVRLIA